VLYLLAAPPARGLFDKAIAESSYMITTPELKQAAFGLPSAESAGVALAKKLNAPDIAALRAMDAQTLSDKAVAAGFQPFGNIDGRVLTQQIVEALDKGQQAPVPVLAGFNQGEIRSLRVLAPQPPASAAIYEAQIRKQYGDLADAFLKLYPSTDMEQSILATTRDAMYAWTAERLIRKQAAIGQRAYLYEFDHGYPAADDHALHAFHASELPYVFGRLGNLPPYWPKPPSTPAEQALSDAMVGYWTSFARTGVPTAAGQPDWPDFAKDQGYMHFVATPEASEHVLPGMYAFNEEVVCRRRAAGTQAWNINVGLWSPPLPPPAPGCR
jgi:para-nitrobenzyl esterase